MEIYCEVFSAAKFPKEGIENSFQTDSPYPEIRPSIMTARNLSKALGIASEIFMPAIEWSLGTARYMMHLAQVTERKLSSVHELDCMSVRTIPIHGNGPDQLRQGIWELQFTIKTFLSFADALHRSGVQV